MNARTAFLILAGVVLVGGIAFFTRDPTAPDETDPGIAEHDMVRVRTPRPGEMIESPLRVEGEARGMWFFEASFPVTLLFEDGSVVAEHYAMTADEWMTEEFVSFSSDITFSHPGEGSGWLVLERSNPSGLPEHDDELRIPVRFSAAETMEVSINFNREGVAECEETLAVSRAIIRTRAPGHAALEHLLAGPTPDEARQGYRTSVPTGVAIQRFVIRDGTAEVDLSEALEAGVAGSCRVRAIRSQIENTLLQFSSVDSVIISIDGRVNGILQP